jgi:serine protease
MKLPTPALRWIARGSAGALLVLATGAGAQAAASTAPAIGAPAALVVGSGGPISDPYSPAFHHPYRRGVVPTRSTAVRMRAWTSQHSAAAQATAAVQASSAQNLSYGGGIDGIGVTTGHQKVYLVFYGSQWGTSGTDGNGNMTFTADPSGEAPYLQQMFKGLGTKGELWSGVMTQYCQGVSVGAQSCPSTARHVAFPRGGVLAGVWADESAASPGTADGHQLGTEAVSAAAHFGNTSAAANRDAQYVILSPTGTNPDFYIGNFCAWHDYNGDSTLSGGPVASTYGDIAFTNMPYVTDAGTDCGQDFVNITTGALDGLSIVEGHEYAETITDQNPPGGWTDSGGSENADKCAWITPGSSGGAANLALATGTFAMQGTWANDGNSGKGTCEFTHAIIGTQLLVNPGFESGKLTPWTATSGVLKQKSSSYPAHSGSWLARLDGRGTTHTDTLAQKVRIAPAGGTYTGASFAFWLETRTNDPTNKAYDTLKVQVLNSGGNVVQTLATYSNLNAAGHYSQHLFSLNAYAGQTITIKFTGTERLLHHNTSFFIDDNALNGS